MGSDPVNGGGGVKVFWRPGPFGEKIRIFQRRKQKGIRMFTLRNRSGSFELAEMVIW